MTLRGMRAWKMAARSMVGALGVASICGQMLPLNAQPPAFEAASVKTNRSTAPSGGAQLQPGGRFIANNSTLFNLVRNAYTFDGDPLQTFQIIGPDWIKTSRFDIVATAERNVSLAEAQAMLVTLLVDRFALVVHRERRTLPIYELRVVREGQTGTRLKPSAIDCAARTAAARAPVAGVTPAPECGTRGGAGRLVGTGITMARLAASLANLVSGIGQTVVDSTLLAGQFDLELEWTPDAPGSAASAAPAGASIFTAIQEQLGLKLESTRGPVDVLVIDRVERPREN